MDPAIKTTKPGLAILLTIAVSVFILDQLTKLLILRSFRLYEPYPIIPGLLNLTYVQNQGAAFGFLASSMLPYRTLFLILFSMVAMGFILYSSRRWPGVWRVQVPLAMILGGAAGNLLDRLRYGYVVDFIDVGYGSWHWPVFNAADSCITVGVSALMLFFWNAPAPALKKKKR